MNAPPRRDVVVIGTSTGGVEALQRIAATLEPNLPAAVLVVLHVGANASILPSLLESAGPNSAAHAEDGEPLRYGHIAVAPPDCHMIIVDGVLRLSKGPKENYCRPAIDPLFRSAALELGPRAIGVILTGNLDDGAAGLRAIKECGGLAVVQDPRTAVAPSMPKNACAYVPVDFCLQLEELGRTLSMLIREPAPVQAPCSNRDSIRREQAPLMGSVNSMEDLQLIAVPSPLACPECSGGLWEIKNAQPPRFRCHTGHGYSLQSLDAAMQHASEELLRAAERGLHELAVTSLRLAEEFQRLQDAAGEAEARERANDQEERAGKLRRFIDDGG